ESFGSEIEQAVKTLGRGFRPYTCDFSNREALYAFIRQLKAEVPRIDILINNSGIVRHSSAEGFPDHDWDIVLEGNLAASFILSREIGKTMVERGAGKIIFTASLLSFQGGVTALSYAASKGGI